MNSLIYKGTVMHTRREPVQYAWTLPVCFYGIDIDEITEIERTVAGFGYNHWRPVCLRDRNYLTGNGGFRERLGQYVETSDFDRIMLITTVGFMLRAFNPVSFYYCLRADASVALIVAEVNNTFGDRHLYVLDGGRSYPLTARHDKLMHVSPFNNLEGHYEFSLSAPGENLQISVTLVRAGKVILKTTLCGHGQPLTTASLWRTVLGAPLVTSKTIPRIMWQAALLYFIKKMRVYHRPGPSHPMTIKTGK
ncbi:MAG: DUF1365 domain-containing protein [Kiritimatiellae bacterium]|nr:DUF1365 domain-containing protein [Kiritimatiellia bacterium]